MQTGEEKIKEEKYAPIVSGRAFRRRRVISSKTLVILFLILAIIVFAIVFFSSMGTRKTFQSNTVEFGLRNIGELATQAGYFTSVQMISGSRDIFGVTVPFTQSKYVYSYDGIVKAGVHFEEITVSVDEEQKVISIAIPHAGILDVSVDENSLVVYDESKNIFSPLKLVDIQESMLVMKKEVREKAISNGILKNAESNAETLITGFISGINPGSEYSIQFAWK